MPLDIAGTVEQLFVRGSARYGHQAEYAMIGKLLEEACGTDLRAPGFPETLEDYLATMPRHAIPEVRRSCPLDGAPGRALLDPVWTALDPACGVVAAAAAVNCGDRDTKIRNAK